MKNKKIANTIADALQRLVSLEPEAVEKVRRHLEKQGVSLGFRGYLQGPGDARPYEYFLSASVKPKRRKQ